MKRIIKKVSATKSDLRMALLATPIDSHRPSPTELLNARRYKTNLVRIRNEHITREGIASRLSERQLFQQKYNEQRGATDLAPLIPGQDVRVRDPITGLWQSGKVTPTCAEPRSYEVLSSSGNVVRRNRRHLTMTTPAPSRFSRQSRHPGRRF